MSEAQNMHQDVFSQDMLNELLEAEEQSKMENSAINVTNEASEIEDPISKLSEEQRNVYDSAMDGYSMFFTGDAGTGKSYVLRLIVDGLCQRYGSRKVFITASTGIAACNINGTTLHSFAGIGLGDEPVNKCLKKVNNNKKAKERWQICEVLVIDEVSMLDGRFFDKLELIARRIRGNDRCFGGIQLILCGDFFQLPPVKAANVIYCFESTCWNMAIQKMIIMTHVFRQKDTKLQKVLQDIRYGIVSNEVMCLLRRMEFTQFHAGDVQPTKLFPLARDVDAYNEKELIRLGEVDGEVYVATDEGDPEFVRQLQSCQAPVELRLKVGAQVMLLKNISVEEGLVNGSRGVVESFVQESENTQRVPLIKFATNGGELIRLIGMKEFTIEVGDATKARRIQLPLKLAWAMSIHKSQGMTIDLLEVDLANVFECGMTYVALSRGVSVERMRVLGFSKRGVRTDPKVLQFYTAAKERKPCMEPPSHSFSAEPSHEGDMKTIVQLPCSASLKRPFSAPSKRGVDMDGWRSMYVMKPEEEGRYEYKRRNRFHEDMAVMAEREKDLEKPELPIETIKSIIVFKRARSRRQLYGSIYLLPVC